MAIGIEDFSNDVRAQRDVLETREPAYARILDEVHALLPEGLLDRLATCWSARTFHAFYERPLLLLAAIRDQALAEGPDHPLHRAVTGEAPDPDAVSADAVRAALSPDRRALFTQLRDRYVQTNETSRAVTWLLAAHRIGLAGESRALALVDLGTSAGLNLVADALPFMWKDQEGAPVVLEPRPRVVTRLGLDRMPLDVRDPATARWLRACVWPSDGARLSRLEQGIACFASRVTDPDGPKLDTCNLPDAPSKLRELPDDVVVLGVQSIVRDYMTPDDREVYERGMREFLCERPLAAMWAELEMRGEFASLDTAASITVRFATPDGALRELVLARTHPHPRQLVLDHEACQALTQAFTAGA